MYIEASWRRGGDNAILQSSTVTLGATASVNFKYHMYGSRIGTLRVIFKETSPSSLLDLADISSGNPSTVWQRNGHQSHSWNSANIDLSMHAGKTGVIQLMGIIRHGCGAWRGDIAIDDLLLDAGASAPTSAPTQAPSPANTAPTQPSGIFDRVDINDNQ